MASQCGCTPRTCADAAAADAGVECGTIDDGCGGRIRCGSCPAGQACGAGLLPSVCARYLASGGAWSQEYPWPLTGIRQIHGVGPDDFWGVDAASNTFHWDGAGWARVASTPPLTSLWAAGPDDAWGVADAVYRWNGATWRVVPHPPSPVLTGFRQVRGASAQDVWFTATENFVLRWQPQGWSRWRPGELSASPGVGALWPTSGDDVWAFTPSSLARWNGQAWNPGGTATGFDVWASGPNDAWTAGSSYVWHWNGQTWTSMTFSGSLMALTGTGPSDVWFAGNVLKRWDGSMLQDRVMPPGQNVLSAAWAASPNTLLVGSTTGAIYRYRRLTGSYDTLAAGAGDTRTLNDVWGDGSGRGWAVGNGGLVLRLTGTGTWVRSFASVPFDALCVWGTGTGAWMGATERIFRWDGSFGNPELFGTTPAHAIWGTSITDVWIFTETAFHHWNGAQWSSTPTPLSPGKTVQAAWGAASNDLWAVGTQGAILHWDGTSWTESPQLVLGELIAISGTSATHIEAITASQLLHFDGVSWALGSAPAPTGLTGIWFDSSGIRWLSTSSELFRKGPAGETRISASSPITKLRGWGNEVRVLGGGIWRYQP